MPLRQRGRGFFKELNDRLNDWLPSEGEGDGSSPERFSLSRWQPKTDIYREDGDTIFEVEAPGLHKDDLDVQVDDGLLVISGERRDERNIEEEERDYHRTERFYGTFRRSFSLPNDVDPEQVSASYDDGVLAVRVPTSSTASGQQVEIN